MTSPVMRPLRQSQTGSANQLDLQTLSTTEMLKRLSLHPLLLGITTASGFAERVLKLRGKLVADELERTPKFWVETRYLVRPEQLRVQPTAS
jgi:hypothetical protein